MYDAFYSLTNPAQQITAHVYDVMRSQLPTLDLDEVFEAKEELAVKVKGALQQVRGVARSEVTISTSNDATEKTRAGPEERSDEALQILSLLSSSRHPLFC